MYYYPTNSNVFMVLFWPLLIISCCNELVFDKGFCSLSMSWVIIEVSSILRKCFWLNKHGKYESMSVQVCSITSRHVFFPISPSTPSSDSTILNMLFSEYSVPFQDIFSLGLLPFSSPFNKTQSLHVPIQIVIASKASFPAQELLFCPYSHCIDFFTYLSYSL